jgi:hypothetical protein
MRWPGRELPILAEADVVVCGGGPAGLGAALAAARRGAAVVLVERYGFLGGNFTTAAVGTVCGAYMADGAGGYEPLTAPIATEILGELTRAGAGLGPVPFKETAAFLYVPWQAKRLFDHLIVSEPNIRLLLHTTVADVETDGDRIVGVVIATKRGPQLVRAAIFIDATGDADLAWYAGAPTTISPPGLRQFASMQFVLQHADGPTALAHLGDLSDAIDRFGSALSRDGGALLPTFRDGEFVGAMTRVRNPDGTPIDPTDIDQLTHGEIEGRRLATEAAEFVRTHVEGFADSFLADTAPQLGVREGRRIVGDYVFSGDEVRGGARQPDAIGRCAWPLEFHTEGRSTRYEFLPPGVSYDIAYRSLLPRGITNLLIAGRCISADPDALASARVMAPCLAMGEGAGIAAARAIHERIPIAAAGPS